MAEPQFEEQMEEPEVDSLTADLAAAWDDAEGVDENDIDQHAEAAEAGDEPIEGAGTTDPESGSSVDTSGVSSDPARDTKPAESEAADAPPLSLSPTAREAWKDTPPAMKAEIAKREKDYEAGIMKYAQNARRAEGMDQTLAPYQQYLAMNGGAGQTIQALLQTGATLQMGSPIQKAQTVAQLINQFGIDIQSLDQLLVGQQPKARPEDAVNQAVQQAVAPYQQQLEQLKAMQQQAYQGQQAKIANEVQSFGSTHEFYNDVRGDMADLLDMAAQRGQEMTMEDAYKKACALHPEISNVLASRQRQPTAGQRRAASSITGSMGGEAGGKPHDSVRSALEDAWDNAGRV